MVKMIRVNFSMAVFYIKQYSRVDISSFKVRLITMPTKSVAVGLTSLVDKCFRNVLFASFLCCVADVYYYKYLGIVLL